MSGALTERVFVTKMESVGFEGIEISQRIPFGLDRAIEYPLFTPDLIELMYKLIPTEKQGEVAMSVIVKAVTPG